MGAFADASDVEAIWRPLSTEESQLVDAWIDQASQQIRDEVPDVDGMDVDERIAAGTLASATVQGVVARMVRRVMMNPNGARTTSETIDDYTESTTIDSTLSPGELFISSRELKRLMGIRSGKGQAFSLDIAPDHPITVWPSAINTPFGWSW